MHYQPVDNVPLHTVGPWPDTLERWYHEGLPRGMDVHDYLGVTPLTMRNISGNPNPYPPFEERVLEEHDDAVIATDSWGRTVHLFKSHTSMPEWLDFPVKSPEDLRRVIDEHYSSEHLEARFGPAWEAQVRQAGETGDLLLIDGGQFYWTLRSLAGVEYASYLFYDAPELVDTLMERYVEFTLEGIRRAAELVHIDLIGFGEDIGFKTGPLISPAMFREFILPRYRRVMDAAHAVGTTLTWYDSDGDLRQLLPDLLDVGINGIAPCEVAANMDPVALRQTFGRDLRMIGGVDKRLVAEGRAAIDAEMARLQPVIDDGGFLPAIDHSVPADISFADYCYFIEQLQRALDRNR
jgi:uroporphyrinogen decarboxylase